MGIISRWIAAGSVPYKKRLAALAASRSHCYFTTWFYLPVAAVAATTMRAASSVATTTVKATTSAVEAASPVEATAAMKTATAVEPASGIAASRTAPIATIAWAIAVTSPEAAVSAPIAISPATVGPAGPAIVAATAPAVIPGACADKHAAYEPVRSIVAVRRAGIGCISVIAISTDRRGANPGIHRADSNPNSHANLRLRVARAQQKNSQQNHVF